MKVAGLDVGFAISKRTSGVGTFIEGQIILHREFGGERACAAIIKQPPFQIIAIDGPIIPNAVDLAVKRGIEAVFQLGPFQRRCKPGLSHINGTGRRLREAASDDADRLAHAAPLDGDCGFPLVRQGAAVEAFPNAFLGGCLDEKAYRSMPSKLGRGGKFDWLFDQWVEQGIVARLSSLTAGEKEVFGDYFKVTRDHEKRGALVCLLTAIAAA